MKLYFIIPLLFFCAFLAVPIILLALGMVAVIPFFLIGLAGFIWSRLSDLRGHYEYRKDIALTHPAPVSLEAWRNSQQAVEEEIRRIAA